MSIHRFLTNVSDLNYNFKNVLQIQTCDYNEYSNNGLTISGSSPSEKTASFPSYSLSVYF